MSNTQTQATFAGGVEGVAASGALAQTPIAGVGTTYVAGTTPVLGGGLNMVNAQTGTQAFALPVAWPFAAPMMVSNVGAVAASVFPGAATHQINGATVGTAYAIAATKAVMFWYVGPNNGVPQWIAVGA